MIGIEVGKCHETAFPVAMKPKTLQIINKIVSRSNSIEEVLHPLRTCLIISKIAPRHEGKTYHEEPYATVLKKFF